MATGLAHVERTGEKFEGVSGEMKTLIPKKAMDELKSLLDSDVETIDFAKDESTLFFRVGPRLLTSRQLTGQFPNYEAVLPKDITKSITLHGEELGAAIARVAQFADERSRAVKLRLEKGELKISASSTETGESEDSIEVAYDGEPMQIGFNAQYLIDFIKATGSCEVKLELKDAQSAGQLASSGRRRLQVPVHCDADADLRGYGGGLVRQAEDSVMLSGFKQFILRGNVVDLAVGVVIGAAFGGVVKALTEDLLTPFIAAIVGKPDFSAIRYTIHGSLFPLGDFINAGVSFLLVAAAVYFFVVTPINALIARTRKAPAPADPTTKKCPECSERDSDRCAAVQLLHAGGGGEGGIKSRSNRPRTAELALGLDGRGRPSPHRHFYLRGLAKSGRFL